MTAPTFTPEGVRERYENVGPWKVRLTSYKLGDRYCCTADNVDPGAVLSRAEASTREEAEEKALAEAKSDLVKTRIVSQHTNVYRQIQARWDTSQ